MVHQRQMSESLRIIGPHSQQTSITIPVLIHPTYGVLHQIKCIGTEVRKVLCAHRCLHKLCVVAHTQAYQVQKEIILYVMRTFTFNNTEEGAHCQYRLVDMDKMNRQKS